MKHFFKNIFIFVLFPLWGLGGFGWGAYAQLYPVQLTPVFNSPYSLKLSDYATSMDTKMQLLINPTDISINNRQVRLKFSLQGNGINAKSADFIQGENPIFINGGELQTLTNVDIAALFKLENLQGISAVQYANPLPEGMYNFCFEMYDFITNQKISQKSCSMLYLILNDPPLLNTPQRNEQIAASDFPNILFTWTPRQINATNVSYTYELKELLDPSLDPQYGFQMAPLLYQENDLHSTAMVYDLGKPSLIPGKRYAWRVRAISTSGLSENSVFKNDGYSEVFSFKYTGYCLAPTFSLSEAQGPKSVKISWQGVPEHTRYQLQYRKQGVRNAQWFSVYSQNTQSLLTDLEAGVTYEFRVGSSCDPATEGRQSFTYSGINTFTTPTQTNSVAAYNCGITPKISIQNQKPIDNLIESETFTAGDFPVTILELLGHNPYSGKGYIIVPYLADTKIAVEFKDITINTDYQLINGIIETSYNPDWKNVVDVGELADDIKGLVNEIADLFTRADELEKQKAAGTISEAEYNKNWKEIYEGLEQANNQYKELVNTQDVPEDLKKKIDGLDPVFVELASNNYTTAGNQNKDNLDKTQKVFDEVNTFISNNCNDSDNDKIVLKELDDYKIYTTPIGDAIILRSATNLDLESMYPNEKYPDLKVSKGALVAFTLGTNSYKAKYQKKEGKWNFTGYYDVKGTEYLDTDTDRLKSYFKEKIEKEGVEKAGIALVLVEGSSQGLLRATLVSLGIGETALTTGALVRVAGTTAVLGIVLIKLFGSTITITSHHGAVVDFPNETLPIITDSYLKGIPVDLPIVIPHAIPKEDTGGSCKVYVIWKVATNGNISVAKYGMTCTDDYDENCNMRPEKQCIKFEKENNLQKNKFFYNWVITGITKEMCHIVEKSLTAEYVITHGGVMPSHHYLPCFVRDKQWDEDLEGKPVESERNTRALKWIKDIINQYGAK